LLVAALGLETGGYPQTRVGQTRTRLRCVECGAESDQLASGRRAYLAPEEEDEAEGEILVLCPECAEREFGPSGWEEAR
jgi:hypothetical protein